MKPRNSIKVEETGRREWNHGTFIYGKDINTKQKGKEKGFGNIS